MDTNDDDRVPRGDRVESDEYPGGRPPLTEEDELAVALQRGRDAFAAGRLDDAQDALDDALYLARKLGDEAGEASACGLLAQISIRRDEPEEAARLAEAALGIALARHDEAAARHFQGLVATARSSPQEREMSVAFGDGRQAVLDGDAARAAPRLERALALARELGHRVAEGAASQLLAQACLRLGRRAEAETLAASAEEIATALGDDEAAARARALLSEDEAGSPVHETIQVDLERGREALERGELENGISLLERARDLARAAGEVVPEAGACALLAQAFIGSGRRTEAIDAASRALEVARSLGQDDVATHFEALLEAARADDESHAMAQALDLASLALESGRSGEAVPLLRETLALAEQRSHSVAEATVRGLLARALSGLDQPEEAALHAVRALEICRERGDDRACAHLEALLAEINRLQPK
jgi:tetratricopeptide (TPR) repeat protein